MEGFFTVGQQVAILFILIAVGFLCGKTKLLSETSVKSMTSVVLYIVTPCVIINTFMREFDQKMLTGMLIAVGAALFAHSVAILLAFLIFHDKDERRNRVYKFALVFSNCGFISLPLQQALLGSDGVFYGAVYIAVFNIVQWTYGVFISSGDKKELSAKKIILNPCIIAIAIGLLLFLFSIPMPELIKSPIGYLSALNTPVPMLIIGFYLSQSSFASAFKDWLSFLCVALRLIAVPLIVFGALMLCGIRGTILVSCIISSGASVAAATTMFAARYNNDTALSVNLVTLSTLFSVITLPVIVGMASSIGG